MARSRNIKPGFFINDKLADVDPLGRILFIGLWTIADREGRLEDNPRKIKVQTLPYDDCDIDDLLQQLADSTEQFIIRYQVNGEKYIQIANWAKHQNPHIKETASVIPGIDQADADYELAPDKHQTSTVQEQEMHQHDPADSLNLIPDSLNPIHDQEVCKKNKYPNRVYDLLNYWNKKGVVKHNETDTTLKAIESGLKKHSYEQIITAIDRYVTILNDTNYYYSHKWTLPKFLNQRNGVPEFLDEGQQWVNFNSQVKKGSTKVFDDNYQYSEREAPASDFFTWMGDGDANEA